MWLLAVSAVFLINGSLGFYTELSANRGSSGGHKKEAFVSESTASYLLNNQGRSHLDSGIHRELINGNYESRINKEFIKGKFDKQITIGSRAGKSFSRGSNLDGGGAFNRRINNHETHNGNFDKQIAIGSKDVNYGSNYEKHNGKFDKQITIGSRDVNYGSNYEPQYGQFDKQITIGSRVGKSFSRGSNLDGGRVSNRGFNYEKHNGNFDKQINIGSRAGQAFSRGLNRDGGRLPNGAFRRGNRFEGKHFGNNRDRSNFDDGGRGNRFERKNSGNDGDRSNLDDGRAHNSGINYESNNGNFDKHRRGGGERFSTNYDNKNTADFARRAGSTHHRRSNVDGIVSKVVSRAGSRFDRTSLREFSNVGDGRRGSRGKVITVGIKPRANHNNAYTRI